MRQEMVISSHEEVPSYPVARYVGLFLLLLGVSIACCALWLSDAPIPIERPLILALAPLALLIPTSVPSLIVVQQILCFYLVAVPFNELHLQHVSFSFLPIGISVSQTVGPLLLCGIGCYLASGDRRDRIPSASSGKLSYGWVIAMAIIVVHMILLAALLRRCYGYGYEQGVGALGHLSMYVLLFFALRRHIAERWFRCALAAITVPCYLLSSMV